MATSKVDIEFDAIYFLDVLEHIEPSQEDIFLQNVVSSLSFNGICIAGMPSLESQQYASEISKAGHVNCQTGAQLKKTFERYFNNVLMFSMNDEVLHTGFFPMSQYLLAIGIGKK